jgi:hypothetical protein
MQPGILQHRAMVLIQRPVSKMMQGPSHAYVYAFAVLRTCFALAMLSLSSG